MPNTQQGNGGRWKMDSGSWDTERWVAIIVLLALGMLIAIRMGFRGVNFMGVTARVS